MKKRKKDGQPYAVVDNILDRNFHSDRPLEKLVTDITYLPYGQKQLYLSSILDLYSGEVIAFTNGEKQDTAFVLDTLDQLPTLPENCVLHSDQGSVYTSYEYQKAVKTKGITMTRKGTPADNASIESFHFSLKSETFYLNSIDQTTTAIIERTVIEYIHYYNNIRIQTKQPITDKLSTIGCLKIVLIPVSKTGVSPFTTKAFVFFFHSRFYNIYL